MRKAKTILFAGLLSISLIMSSCDKKGKDKNQSATEYTIKFVDFDDELLSEIKVKEGTVPVYDKEEPYRDPTKQYNFEFSGWDPEIIAATQDATYVAQYSSTVKHYTVNWIVDGRTITEDYEYGATPTFKGSTDKPSTPKDHYTFIGWDKEIKKVDRNATYTAIYESAKNTYVVTFVTNCDTEIPSQTVEYGECAQQPQALSKDPSDGKYFIFNGWDYNFSTPITESTTITAQWIEVAPTEHGSECVYIHYPYTLPTTQNYGYQEFWHCPIHDQYVLGPSAPEAYQIFEAGSHFSGLTPEDPRYIDNKFSPSHLPLTTYSYDAGMYCHTLGEFKNHRVTYLENGYKNYLYSENNEFYIWRIDLPRIDFTKYSTVTMDVKAPDWYNLNKVGPEANELNYQTVYGGDKNTGKIKLYRKTTGLDMEFYNIEYSNQLWFTKTFTDTDIIEGRKSAYFYVEDKWDRYVNIENIILSTEKPLEATSFTYGGDTSKITAEYAEVKVPGSVDYGIINNGYGTNNNSLVIDSPDGVGQQNHPVVFTLPAFNFNQYTSYAQVEFNFGVRNNKEHMYFGSGDSKIDLGQNSPTSESTNNNGYVNWTFVVTANNAYVHNKYEDHDYEITLSNEVRAGTERIVLSGGKDSIYRRYFVTDYFMRAV